VIEANLVEKVRLSPDFREMDFHTGTQFTCFASTKAQMLTPDVKSLLSLLAVLVQEYKY
jgi:hypothetical protein